MGKRFTKKSLLQLNKIFLNYGIDCVCEFGDELQFIPDDNIIIIEKEYDASIDEYFLSHLRGLGLKKEVNAIILSILHELGHYATVDTFTEFEWKIDSLRKETLCFANEDDSPAEIMRKYYETPTEKAAQMWAVKTVNEHPDFIKDLEKVLGTTREG